MNILLDTHLLLWAAGNPERLSKKALELIENPDYKLLFSVASIWEVAIKRSLGRDDFQVDPRLLRRALLEHGYQELVIHGIHATAVDTLPAIHKDPFDRILIAQSTVDGILLLTSDQTVAQYPGSIQLV